MYNQASSQFGLAQIKAKIALMSEHDPFIHNKLPDPYYGEADGFERVA
jgi:protein-tyrosine phosphatase